MRRLILPLLLLLAACAGDRPRAPTPPAGPRADVTILISIDAFRPDYLRRGITPNLSALAAGGVSAEMRPSFPTKTYPNHYTLVTGLRPDRHGIVGNKMRDPARPGDTFTMQDSLDPFWWAGGEPIWVAAERAGIPTASVFWPGAQAAWRGVLPRDRWVYEKGVPAGALVDRTLEWLARPAAQRPRFVALYFELVDTATHHQGVASAEGDAAIAAADAQIGRLRAGLVRLGLRADLVVVSDHGMAPSGPDRAIMLDTLAPATDWDAVEDGANLAVYPRPGREAALAAALLGRHDHFACWRPREIPARLRYGRNRRVPPIFCLPDEGWLILATPKPRIDLGSHGYDNDLPSMRALFVANGPSFPAGRALPVFDNVDVYPLLRHLVGLPPIDGIDGKRTIVRAIGSTSSR